MINRSEVDPSATSQMDTWFLRIGTFGLLAGFIGLRLLMPYVAPLRFDFSLPGPESTLLLQAIASLGFGIGALLLVYVEIRKGAVTGWLENQLSGGWRARLFLTLFFFALSSHFLLPGNPTASDGIGRIHNTLILKQYLQSGQLPVYAMFSWMGFAPVHAGSRLYELPVALLDLALNDIMFSTKIMLTLLNLCTGFSMYAALREIKISPITSLAGSTAYALSAYRYAYQMDNGREPLSLFYALLPLGFLAAYRLIRHWRLKDAALLALVSGALIWTHLTFGAAALGFIILFTLGHYLFDLGMTRETVFHIKQPGLLLLGLGGGFAVSALFVVPMLLDQDVMASTSRIDDIGYSLGAIYPVGVFRVQPETFRVLSNTGYISNVILLLAAASTVVGIKHKSSITLAYGILTILSLFLALGGHLPIYDRLFDLLPFGYLIYIVKSSGYYLMYALIGGVMLAAVLIDRLAAQDNGGSSPNWLVRVLLAVAIFGSLAVLASLIENRIQQLYLPIYGALIILPILGVVRGKRWLTYTALPTILLSLVIAELLPVQLMKLSYVSKPLFLPNTGDIQEQLLADQGDTQARAIDLRPENLVRYDIPLNTGIACLYCGSNEIAPRYVLDVSREVWLELVTDLRGRGELGPAVRNFLYVANVSNVITSEELVGEVRLISTAHSPVVASTQLAAIDTDDFRDLLSQLDIDFESAQAERLFVRQELPHMRASDADLQIAVLDHRESLTDAHLSFTLSDPAFVQISYAYFPFIVVTDRGMPIEFYETSFGMIGFWTEAGTHELHIRRGYTPAQMISTILSLIAILGTITILLYDPVRKLIDRTRQSDSSG